MRRALAALLLALAVWTAVPAGAQTNTAIDQAVAAFRKGEPVFIHPDAELRSRLKDDEVADMRSRLRKGKAVVYVAVLPAAAVDEANGDVDALPSVIHRRLGFAGTYAVLSGASFRATNYEPDPIDAKRLADAAFAAHQKGGPSAVLLDFVIRVENERSGSGGSKTALVVGLVALLTLGAAAAAVLVMRRPRHPQAEPVDPEAAPSAEPPPDTP